MTFMELHSEIRSEGHRTLGGKYYDTEWNGFVELARGVGEGTDDVREPANWEAARSRYEHILRGILVDAWFRRCTMKRLRLTFLILVSSFGYALISLPSVDLFFAVLFTVV